MKNNIKDQKFGREKLQDEAYEEYVTEREIVDEAIKKLISEDIAEKEKKAKQVDCIATCYI